LFVGVTRSSPSITGKLDPLARLAIEAANRFALQFKAATTLRSYDAPLDVCYEEQHIRLAEVLDSFLYDDDHPEFKDVDDYIGDDVPEIPPEERTETFPEEDESACKGCGKTIGEDDDWVPVPGHSATGVLCLPCADATVRAEEEVATGN
jgi:hypothetical protein